MIIEARLDATAQASVRGSAVAREVAIEEAARVLRDSRMPVIAGLETDADGAEAAVALARRIGAAVDHAAGAALIGLRDAMVGVTTMLTTPPEARARADLFLVVGSGIAESWPEVWSFLQPEKSPTLFPEIVRQVIRLCPGNDPPPPGRAQSIGGELVAELSVLRALMNSNRVTGGASIELEACAAALKAARYGVVIWSGAQLDPLETEMLLGLVEACNATTRCAGLPLAPPGNALGVAQACTWSAGFPTRFGLGGETDRHDAWRFDATRMVEAGEADAVVWIAEHAPPWLSGPPSIVLSASAPDFTPHVHFAIGTPGRDHAALLHAQELGALAHYPALRASHAPSAATILRELAERVGRC